MVYRLDFYNEVIFSIALQKLAYEISIAKNINPDKPKNLAKVVSVEWVGVGKSPITLLENFINF